MKTLLLLFLVVASLLPAQTPLDTPVKITGRGPNNSSAVVTVTHKGSQVSYSIGSGTIDGAGSVVLPISIANRTGSLPSALQFDLTWTAADITSLTVDIGPAASTASKVLNCAAVNANTLRCVIAGGLTGITDGVIANAKVQTSMTSQTTTTVMMLGTVSATVKGSAVNSIILPNGGVIAMPAILAEMSCAQPDIWEELTVACSVRLNKPAPTGGTAIALAADSSVVTLPASITVPAGSTTASFNVVGN